MNRSVVSDTGTRHERALKAVEEIGPAVFNGGFTTFLALALLGFSTSQIFLTFFKVRNLGQNMLTF
jgi:Niemann-Pick C1 protein